MTLLSFVTLSSEAHPQDQIFSDDFEAGDTSRWSQVVPPPPKITSCLGNAPPPASLRAGDLGPAPAGAFERLTCIEVRNDLDLARLEVARSGVLIAAAHAVLDTENLALVAGEGGDSRRVAAQFDVLSRWGGPSHDTTLPIRWLAVAVQAELPAADLSDPNEPIDTVAAFELRHYETTPAAPNDGLQLVTSSIGTGALQFDNGVARFVFDPTSPGALHSVDLFPVGGDLPGVIRVLDGSSAGTGTGPRLSVVGGAVGGGDLQLDSTTGAVELDGPPLVDAGFETVHCGPVHCQVIVRGHLTSAAGETLCQAGGGTPYESVGYSAVFTILRGERAVDVDWVLRNECTDAANISWTDDVRTWRDAGWSLPLVGQASSQLSHAVGTSVESSSPGFTGVTRVEQIKGTGAGTAWLRRARIRRDANDLQTAEFFDSPLIALEANGVLTVAHTAWARFREPIGMRLSNHRLDLLTVAGDTPLVVGEGKGLWNRARVQWEPSAGGPATAAQLVSMAEALGARTERALLVRAPVADLNASGALPSLGEDRDSSVRDVYRSLLDDLHQETVDFQWAEVSTYGSQLWPDVQFDRFLPPTGPPADNDGRHNYWNASYAEAVEFLRVGEPRWAWEIALPLTWLMQHTAYLNTGPWRNNLRNGAAVNSGGVGEGQWHRSAFGSDDYTYNRGMHLAYALQPNALLRDRFTEQGLMVFDRYDVPAINEETRDFFLQRVTFERQQMQHFENLANCAEFSDGANGTACHQRLMEILHELATDNLATGVMCQGDVAPDPSQGDTCFQPQQFMQTGMMYGFLQRLWRNYASTLPTSIAHALARTLVRGPEVYYSQGLARSGDAIDLNGPWASILDCTMAAGGTDVDVCSFVQNSDGDLPLENKAQTLALLLIAGAQDPETNLCAPASTAFEDPAISTFLSSWAGSGWWKGAAQMMQNLAFGVGAWEQCNATP